MLHEQTKPSTPAKGREADTGLLSDSSGPVSPVKRLEILPPYGAQHRRDALWEGGNEALPPMWIELDKVEANDQPVYQDNTHFMISEYRPLPGVRLDSPGYLIPGCEWHISSLGRSYFVNHNTRTTSWKKPTPERAAGSLMPECMIKCDNRYNNILACLGTSGNIMSTSEEGSIHQWTRAGKPVGKPWDGDRNPVTAMAVSVDETMVVCGSFYGRVRLWNMKERSVVGDPWEGSKDTARCLDWSPNGMEVAGGSRDGTIRRWNPATGRQIPQPIKRSDESVFTVKYSPQGDKFASGGFDKMICVWSKDGELLIEIKGHEKSVTSLCWSKDGAYIFSASNDDTIRKWQSIDGKELAVFQGHTNTVTSICLSPDGCHLFSASMDYSVRIWDLKTNQQLGDPLWHDDHVSIVSVSSNGQYFASAIIGPNSKIYVWSLEAVLKRARGVDGTAEPNAKLKGRAARPRDISLARRHQGNNRGLARYGNDFFVDDTDRTPRRSADTSSPPGLRNLFGFLRSTTRPANSPQPIQLQPRRLNFSSFPVRISRRPVDVAPCRDEDRYGIVPESDAEAAAAMQRTSSNNATSSTAQEQAAAGVHEPQGQPTQTQTQSSTGEAGEFSYEVICCGFPAVRVRRRRHDVV